MKNIKGLFVGVALLALACPCKGMEHASDSKAQAPQSPRTRVYSFEEMSVRIYEEQRKGYKIFRNRNLKQNKFRLICLSQICLVPEFILKPYDLDACEREANFLKIKYSFFRGFNPLAPRHLMDRYHNLQCILYSRKGLEYINAEREMDRRLLALYEENR